MNRFALLLLAATVVAGCNSKQSDNIQSSAASPSASSDSTPAQQPSPPVVVAPAPPPPSHHYAMSQDGTYGYEPALSEDDVRAGKATKALVMMRYVGVRDGSYILLLVDEDNPNISNRITCQAPCNFAKSQTMAGDSILKTETLRVVPNSLIGAMIEDAMSGQLTPYGQRTSALTPSTLPVAQSPANQPASDATTSPLQQTSFDCTKAKSIPEFLICHDADLAAADRDLATTYQQAKDAVIDKTAFVERTRKQWNFREKNCRDKECLTSWYAYQKRILAKIAQTGDVTAQDN
ncbi:putative lipoprotein [Burkholderia cenocepacia HI2424]|uniref:Lipoprotein n=4 Tax=Burkholderia cepacia complex TaxID=87882 RepID=A0A427NM02_9BURK|nr:putative lipoprotein [Burkholderia cenocepacia HI2424]ACA94954.1 putative lipoprotein [Burkholderia orbicola MC0-3]AQQ24298.1 hypothetical protein A8E88_00750 [Burkholderia cenocepacia]ONV95024.1 hypothetical protein A8E89_09375 [Burkholderia cenocepacia]ONW10397.1 hypothetical protein A8E90_26695 [Burkholderia cenocepacia]